MAKVKVLDNGCWQWTSSGDGRGYGQISIKDRPHKAHRVAYELFGDGTLIKGLQLDHLCRNRGCVNPEHLEQVTNRVNTLRGASPKVVTYRTGICQRGHSMSDAIRKPDGKRTCRKCENERQMRYYYARKKAAA